MPCKEEEDDSQDSQCSADYERKTIPYMASEPNPVDEEYYTYCDEGYFMQYIEY